MSINIYLGYQLFIDYGILHQRSKNDQYDNACKDVFKPTSVPGFRSLNAA